MDKMTRTFPEKRKRKDKYKIRITLKKTLWCLNRRDQQFYFKKSKYLSYNDIILLGVHDKKIWLYKGDQNNRIKVP